MSNINKVKRISVGDAHSMIGSGNVNIVDIRDTESYNSDHLDSAQNITSKNADQFIKTAEKNKPLIVYCYHGNSSQVAGKFFAEKGFKDVYSVDGGYEKLKL